MTANDGNKKANDRVRAFILNALRFLKGRMLFENKIHGEITTSLKSVVNMVC